MTGFHLAQINIGHARAPVDDPLMAPFMARLDEINALADRSPGFVWRLQDDSGNATAIPVTDDPLVIVNLSVWESLEALSDFVYRTAHAPVMARRLDWFERHTAAYLALWWSPAGTLPTVAEGLSRIDHLQRNGPGAQAFTFKRPFAAPASDDAAD